MCYSSGVYAALRQITLTAGLCSGRRNSRARSVSSASSAEGQRETSSFSLISRLTFALSALNSISYVTSITTVVYFIYTSAAKGGSHLYAGNISTVNIHA